MNLPEVFQNRHRNGMAFGVDPNRREFFSLRQSRYDHLGKVVAELARDIVKREGRKARILDIGPWDGVMLRHLEGYNGLDDVEYSVAELALYDGFYRKDLVKEFFIGDFMKGYPEIPDNHYDIVVCEQVLEHLTELNVPIKTMERVLKPGGTLIVGVPTFPPPLHIIREYGQPVWDRIFPPGKVRGHVQSFSPGRLKAYFSDLTNLEFVSVRGFRIFSGGIVKPLEEKAWWWRLASAVGRAMPSLCIEVQAIYRKPFDGK